MAVLRDSIDAETKKHAVMLLVDFSIHLNVREEIVIAGTLDPIMQVLKCSDSKACKNAVERCLASRHSNLQRSRYRQCKRQLQLKNHGGFMESGSACGSPIDDERVSSVATRLARPIPSIANEQVVSRMSPAKEGFHMLRKDSAIGATPEPTMWPPTPPSFTLVPQ